MVLPTQSNSFCFWNCIVSLFFFFNHVVWTALWHWQPVWLLLNPDLGSSFWGMALILASTNLITARIAAGCFVVALLVVLFVAKNVRLSCSIAINGVSTSFCSIDLCFYNKALISLLSFFFSGHSGDFVLVSTFMILFKIASLITIHKLQCFCSDVYW